MTIADLVARARDSESQTDPERAAALTAAAHLGAADTDLPYPPPGWHWLDGRVVRAEPSGVIPPIRVRKESWWGEQQDEGTEAPIIVAPEPEQEPVAIAAPASEESVPAYGRLPSPWSRGGRAVAMAQRAGGATIDEIVVATRLKPHSIKAILSMARRAPGGPAVEYVRGERRFRPVVD